jgi:hypothetical protein
MAGEKTGGSLRTYLKLAILMGKKGGALSHEQNISKAAASS